MKRLNGIFPLAGTVVGPDWSGLRWTVVSTDERGCTLRPMRKVDLEAVMLLQDPRSLAEIKILGNARRMVHANA